MIGGQEDLLPLDEFHPLRVERAIPGKPLSTPIAAPISIEHEVWGNMSSHIDLRLREPGSILRDLSGSSSPKSCALSPTCTPVLAPRKQSSPMSVRSDASTAAGDEPAMVLVPGYSFMQKDSPQLRPRQNSLDEDSDRMRPMLSSNTLSSHDEEDDEDLESANRRLAMENAMLRMQWSVQLSKLHEIGAMQQSLAPQSQNQQTAPGTRLSREINSMLVRCGNPNEADVVDADTECDSDASTELPVDSRHYSGDLVTVMLRNLPNNYSRRMLLELMDQLGFVGNYDFVYLPIDFKTQASLGYAFVNLTSSDDANRFCKCFSGFSDWALPSQKVCKVNWSKPYQGLTAHVERYRNSPVMHEAVPDEFKPALFSNGERSTFPPPTKKIRAPRMRPGRSYLRSALAA
jgi:hypothetical protein